MNILKSYQPRVLVLGGNPGKWNCADSPDREKYTTGVESWVYAFGGNYRNILETKPNDIRDYDIIIGNSESGKYLEHLLELIDNRQTNTKWVTLIEGCGTDYLKPNLYYRNLFDRSDLLNCINSHTLNFFRSLTKTPVAYIGIPYPVAEIAKMSVPFEQRKKEIFLCSMMSVRINDYLAVFDLDLPLNGFEKRNPRNLRTILPLIKKYGSLKKSNLIDKAKNYYRDDNLKIARGLVPEDYFPNVAGMFFWINLDPRYTWSRFVIDAAALRIPIITTKSTAFGSELFPATTVDNEFQVEEALSLAIRLIEDKDFYRSVAEYPADKMDFLTKEAMVEKLLKELNL